MTADHLAARLLEALLSLRARFFPHQRPKVYEIPSVKLAKLARERGWCKREPWIVTTSLGDTCSLPFLPKCGTLVITSDYAEEFGSKGERAS